MNITIIGAGNSGLAMAAHLGYEGHRVTLWNRSRSTVEKLLKTHTVYLEGVIEGEVKLDLVTTDMKEALRDPDLILITTPANSHKQVAMSIAQNLRKETTIILHPGRTFGALEFKRVFEEYNQLKQTIAETQTIIYTCRKVSEDKVNILSFKSDVLISTFDADRNPEIISSLPKCIQKYYKPAKSLVETSIGNVGMILHVAPLLLNTGWAENEDTKYRHYYDGITPTIAAFIEKIDEERVLVSEALGHRVETTLEWMKRTYQLEGDTLYECIQNNEAYKFIDAPTSLKHRYIFEDVPCGLVPVESVGLRMGLNMSYTTLTIDLACKLLNTDFRAIGRI